MKQGKSYPELLMAIKDDKFNKKDFVGDTRKFAVAEAPESPVNLAMIIGGMPKMFDEVAAENAGNLPATNISRLAMNQICSKLNIPFKYAERLFGKYPDILAHDINALFSREPKKIMVRTLGDTVRAVLSNRYRIIDNFDVAAAIMPIITGLLGDTWQNCVRSCDVTENKMYIKIVHPSLRAEIPPPAGAVMGQGHTIFTDMVQAAIVLTNSEVGLGSLSISPSVYTQRCTNLAVFKGDKYTKYHVGREHTVHEDISDVISDETRSLEDAATISKVRDVARAALDGTTFQKQVAKLTEARSDKIEQSPVDAVERLADSKGLNQDEADEILKNLIEGADLSRYGLHAAVTRTAESIENYDRSSELEHLGGEIIELPKADWRVISEKRKAA